MLEVQVVRGYDVSVYAKAEQQGPMQRNPVRHKLASAGRLWTMDDTPTPYPEASAAASP